MGVSGESSNYFVVRTPALPLKVMGSMERVDPQAVSAFIAARIAGNPRIADALFLASAPLYNEVRHHLDNHLPFPDKLAATVYKYILRMASRATPFGLFSSVAQGTVAPVPTAIRLTGEITPYTRTDMVLGEYLRDELLADRACYHHLTFFPNSSIHIHEDHYRFFVYRNRQGKKECHWIRVAKNPLIEAILKQAAGGAAFANLLAIAAGFDIPHDRAVDFIVRLTAEQLLLTDLEPTMAGEGHFPAIRTVLEKMAGEGKLPFRYRQYLKIGGVLRQVNQRCAPLAGAAAAVSTATGSCGPAAVFQTDSRSGMQSAVIGRQLADTVVREIAELAPLYRNPIPKQLSDFRDRFSERYGTREVPLLEALDLDRGVGYGSPATQYLHENPLLEGLNISYAQGTGGVAERLLGNYTFVSTGREQPVLKLEQQDLEVLKQRGDVPAFPSQGCYAMGNLLVAGTGNQQPTPNNFRFNLLACGGPSAVPLMTRFAHLDSNLQQSLQQSASAEQQLHPQEIVAEIVHMPGARIGNIIQRPSLYRYEIPVLGRSTVPVDYQIGLADIMVSVTGDEVVLRSKRLDKIIRPRLSSAHNYQSGMDVYRFLCDVQEQYAYRLHWDWGEALRYRTFLPRVVYKHLILQRAQWNIPAWVYGGLKAASPEETVEAVRSRFGLPRNVVLAAGDNEIPLDLANGLSVRILGKALKAGHVRLYEPLYPEFSSPVMDNNGDAYHNEVILPFFLKGERTTALKPPVNMKHSVQRVFPPGSEWVYVKLYCGQKEADRILVEWLDPFLTRIAAKMPLKKWFFIRYWDTAHHLRIRFHLENTTDAAALTALLGPELGKLIDRGMVHSIQYDTYVREVERYGGKSVEHCEAIFHQHSRFMLQLGPALLDPHTASWRWLLAAKGVDRLLDTFGIPGNDKLGLVSAWSSSMLQEYGRPAELKRRLDQRYREVKQELAAYMEQDKDALPGTETWADLEASVRPYVHGIKLAFGENWAAGGNSGAADLLFSLSHMNLNRLFYSNQRENELVIYHLLAKYYRALAGKQQHARQSTALQGSKAAAAR